METYIFNPDELDENWKEIFDGIEARKIPTGSIELKINHIPEE